VHDELLFEIHKRELDIIEDIKDIMTNVYPSKNGIKLSVEETYYKSWGEPHGQEARDIV
jgi:DNA polymerase I-like protein with 3'-5' exonuclease and polymerase domains